jgi:holo-[acyl-carrier protein] synthase
MAAIMEPQLTVLYRRLYPFLGGFESLELFGDGDLSDIRFVRCRLTDIDEKTALFELEALDSLGRLAERIRGLKKVFARVIADEELTENVWNSLRENPRQREIRELLQFRRPLGIASIELRMLDRADPAEVASNLGQHEQSLCDSLKSRKRRLEFLAGRIAGKAAVQLLRGVEAPDFKEIEILREPDGQPKVESLSLKRIPNITIAHNRFISVALASEDEPFGVDVEDVQDSIIDIRDDFCNEEEVEMVNACLDVSIYKSLTHLWTIKESVRKVVGPYRCPVQKVKVVDAKVQGDYLVSKVLAPDESAYGTVSYFSGPNVFAFSRKMTFWKEGT